MVEVGQHTFGHKFPGQHVCHFSASCILHGHALGEFLLEQKPLLRGSIPKVGHGDLVSSAIGITRVSATFNFFVLITFVTFFWPPQANGRF